jgi:hypothetical protein
MIKHDLSLIFEKSCASYGEVIATAIYKEKKILICTFSKRKTNKRLVKLLHNNKLKKKTFHDTD